MSRQTRPIKITPTAIAVLEERTAVDAETGCWEWTGHQNKYGYGATSFGDGTYLAHRVSYTMHKGAIPDGHVLDHLCRNHACINPNHLEAVTDRENVLRGMSPGAKALRRDRCIRGHLYADYARFWQGRRTCAACASLRLKAFRAKRRAEKAA